MMLEKIKKIFSSHILLLAIIFALAMASLALLVQDFQLFSRRGLLRPRQFSREYFGDPLSISTSTVATIAPWMTFHYVEKVFLLPSGYLRDTLHVSDSHYPALTIKKYARTYGLDEKKFMETVRQAVLDFHTAASSTP